MKNTLQQFSLTILVVLFFGCSTSSDGNGNSTTDVVPVAPSNLSGSAVSTSQINLSWTDNSTNETGFKIERKTGTGIFTVVGTTTSNVTTFIDNGLTPSTAYIYRVYSYNSSGDSATYSDEEIVITNSTFITDIDGNVYQYVTICNQTWTKSNLNVSKYSDGTSIPQVPDPTAWSNLTTGAWCYYNNSTANGITFGKLYNWYAVVGIYDAASTNNPALRKKLAPMGWHIPTDGEWSSLINCLDPSADGGNNFNSAGGKMKATGTIQAGNGLWQDPNTDATNESGFTGLPGGGRYNNGTFDYVGTNGFWWSSSEDLTLSTFACMRPLNYNNGIVPRNMSIKKLGFSVRCIRD